MKGKIIAIVVIIIAIIAILLIFGGSISQSVRITIDPCARQLQDCNYGCGEGWLAGFWVISVAFLDRFFCPLLCFSSKFRLEIIADFQPTLLAETP